MAETREIYAPAGERTKPGIRLHISSSARIAWAIVLFFLLVWEAGVWFTQVPPYLLPAPSLILTTLVTHPLDYALAASITLAEALTGLIIGVLAGVVIAALLTLRPGLEGGVMTLAILV